MREAVVLRTCPVRDGRLLPGTQGGADPGEVGESRGAGRVVLQHQVGRVGFGCSPLADLQRRRASVQYVIGRAGGGVRDGRRAAGQADRLLTRPVRRHPQLLARLARRPAVVRRLLREAQEQVEHLLQPYAGAPQAASLRRTHGRVGAAATHQGLVRQEQFDAQLQVSPPGGVGGARREREGGAGGGEGGGPGASVARAAADVVVRHVAVEHRRRRRRERQGQGRPEAGQQDPEELPQHDHHQVPAQGVAGEDGRAQGGQGARTLPHLPVRQIVPSGGRTRRQIAASGGGTRRQIAPSGGGHLPLDNAVWG